MLVQPTIHNIYTLHIRPHFDDIPLYSISSITFDISDQYNVFLKIHTYNKN